MKIAIFGGSFNPIHNGHICMVNFLIEKYNFDKILIIPIGIPSHKENILVSGKDRLEMCRLAFIGESKIEISSMEIDDKRISYTIDTLMKVKKNYPKSEIYEIIGEDSAVNFHLWKDYEKIFENSKVLVFKREHSNPKEIKEMESFIKDNLERFEFMTAPYFQFSSTEIRERLKNWNRIDDDGVLKKMLPLPILKYIEDKKLYIS